MDLTAKIQQHTESMNEAIGRGDYEQAQFIKTEIDKITNSFKSDVTQIMEADHAQQLQSIHESYAEEVKEFNEKWEKTLAEYNDGAETRMQHLKYELQQKLDELEQNFKPRPLRYSSALIHLRDSETRLARSGRFEEAKHAQREADVLEKREFNEHQAQAQVLKEQQRLEIIRFFEKQAKALKQKIDINRAQLLSNWAADMDKLEKHHDTLIKQENIRFAMSKNPQHSLARSIVPTKMNLSNNVASPIRQYIEQQGSVVDTNQVGASMSPVLSRDLGLNTLR